MYKTPCSRLTGLVGASVSGNQKLLGRNAPRNHQSARSLIQLSRRDPSQWITFQHLNFLKRQYVMTSNNALYQRADPKQTAILTVLEDHRDGGVDRQIQQVPTIDHVPVVTDVTPPPLQPETTTTNVTATPVSSPVSTVSAQEILTLLKATSSKTVSPPQTKAVSSAVESGTEMLEVPHLQVESDEAREARLDRQWKELKVDLAELPDVYAKLAKIKLTALVVWTAAAGFAMAPVPFDPATFFLASLGTGLASCTANSINQ
ncbi:unnamed protein product, partial [Coregonus sp. 'balchen']